MEYKCCEELNALTPEEQASPLAKYYLSSPPVISPEILAALRQEEEMDPNCALMPENVYDILKPGYHEIETGYCTLPDGGGYICVLNSMPEITLTAHAAFMSWWPGDNLKYKIWCPSKHYASGYGWVNEDIGNGPEDIFFLKSLTPGDFLFAPEAYAKSKTKLICSSNGLSKPSLAHLKVHPISMVVAHFVRPVRGGLELRSRFWMGYQCNSEQGLHQVAPPNWTPPVGALYRLAMHCALENANLRRVVPMLCADGVI